MFEIIPEMLRKAHEDGALLFIMTNQKGAKKDVSKLHAVMGKIDDLVEELKVPLIALIAVQSNEFRKPAVGFLFPPFFFFPPLLCILIFLLRSWELLVKTFFDGEKVGSIPKTYVGDAAGRPDSLFFLWVLSFSSSFLSFFFSKDWDKKGAKKDFSCSDRKYALNVGINFRTPEDFFIGESKEGTFSLSLSFPPHIFSHPPLPNFSSLRPWP